MADPVGFEGVNCVYTAPEGQEDSVRDLPTFKTHNEVIACWRLTEDELAQVAETGVVWVRMMGHTVVPHYVSGEALVTVGDRPAKAEPYLNRKV